MSSGSEAIIAGSAVSRRSSKPTASATAAAAKTCAARQRARKRRPPMHALSIASMATSTALGAVGVAAAPGERKGDVRPGQRVDEERDPGRRRRALLPQPSADAQRAKREPEHARQVHAPREAQALLLRALSKL